MPQHCDHWGWIVAEYTTYRLQLVCTDMEKYIWVITISAVVWGSAILVHTEGGGRMLTWVVLANIIGRILEILTIRASRFLTSYIIQEDTSISLLWKQYRKIVIINIILFCHIFSSSLTNSMSWWPRKFSPSRIFSTGSSVEIKKSKSLLMINFAFHPTPFSSSPTWLANRRKACILLEHQWSQSQLRSNKYKPFWGGNSGRGLKITTSLSPNSAEYFVCICLFRWSCACKSNRDPTNYIRCISFLPFASECRV